ncbi:hypothetical protein H0H81_000381 [Sphagnurus paluster]|uniref:Uncharacterized protein n=1 Tax=Sphagnurus paluster TaxID=117069 RepID=A0A9P7K6Y4_9AGAR|nr:hypothetical protein H0H81_000381 [Sphagnurus paluster]
MNSPTPSPRNQIPAIYTDIDEEFSISLNSPTSPQPEDVPSLRVSGPPHTPISPTTPRKQSSKSKTTNRAWNESRKLLSHVLDQLERRTLPPSVLDALDTAEREVVILKKHKPQAKAYSQTGPDSDSDNDGEYGFSSDATYDLMMQFKDVLIMAADQGWHIFDDK